MLIDVALQDLVENHDLVHGAILAGGAGHMMWHEAEDAELAASAMLPGSCRRPRGNPEIVESDVASGIDKLERICGS